MPRRSARQVDLALAALKRRSSTAGSVDLRRAIEAAASQLERDGNLDNSNLKSLLSDDSESEPAKEWNASQNFPRSASQIDDSAKPSGTPPKGKKRTSSVKFETENEDKKPKNEDSATSLKGTGSRGRKRKTPSNNPKKKVKSEPNNAMDHNTEEEDFDQPDSADDNAETPPSRSSSFSLKTRGLSKRTSSEKKFKQTIKKEETEEAGSVTSGDSADSTFSINRTPVLTLWVAAVAESEGYSWDAAVTFGRYISGMFAQAKGRSVGVFEPKDRSEKKRARPELDRHITIMGRKIPIKDTNEGPRAMSQGKAMASGPVLKYLEKSFKEHLQPTKEAMQFLARSMDRETLEHRAYDLYTEFRPEIESGPAGWGKRGSLDLEHIRNLAPPGHNSSSSSSAPSSSA